jgi:hypothetical protein
MVSGHDSEPRFDPAPTEGPGAFGGVSVIGGVGLVLLESTGGMRARRRARRCRNEKTRTADFLLTDYRTVSRPSSTTVICVFGGPWSVARGGERSWSLRGGDRCAAARGHMHTAQETAATR